MLLAGLIGIGLTSGFLGGLLGIGGGVVIVPGLILLFEATGAYPTRELTVVAVATSLACIVFTSLSAAYAQHRAGKVRWDLVRRLAAFFVVGSVCAGWLAPQLPTAVLRGLIGTFFLGVAVIMLTAWRPRPSAVFPGPPGSALLGVLGGLMSGIAGIAGGNVIVPTLVYYDTPMHNATATSSALGVPIAAAGALSYALSHPAPATSTAWHWGYIDGVAFIVVTACAALSARYGVAFAHRVPARRLKRAFGVLLALVATRMLVGAVSQL